MRPGHGLTSSSVDAYERRTRRWLGRQLASGSAELERVAGAPLRKAEVSFRTERSRGSRRGRATPRARGGRLSTWGPSAADRLTRAREVDAFPARTWGGDVSDVETDPSYLASTLGEMDESSILSVKGDARAGWGQAASCEDLASERFSPVGGRRALTRSACSGKDLHQSRASAVRDWRPRSSASAGGRTARVPLALQ